MSDEQGSAARKDAQPARTSLKAKRVSAERKRYPQGFVEERTQWMGLPANPWLPAPFDRRDQAALKALRDGTASPHQQQRALGWILFAAGLNDDPSRPGGVEGARATERALGKHAIAIEIRRLLELPLIGKEPGGGEQGDR